MNLIQNVNTLIQYGLPGHILSEPLGDWRSVKSADQEFPDSAIHSRFNIQMDEVAEPALDAYPHFNAFFTRALKDGIRPLAGKNISPHRQMELCSAEDSCHKTPDSLRKGIIFHSLSCLAARNTTKPTKTAIIYCLSVPKRLPPRTLPNRCRTEAYGARTRSLILCK